MDKLGLEEIVHISKGRFGLCYCKEKAEHLELSKPTTRARVALRLDNGEISKLS